MRIKHVEIGNFRKLKAVRIDFASEKTVLVGANNSGKTSAMMALRRFLVEPSFTITDLTLSHWKALNASAESWEKAVADDQPVPKVDWTGLLPFLDIWLHADLSELHYVRKLIPTLDWAGGLLGVRLSFQPKDADELQREYLKAKNQVAATLAAAANAAVPEAVVQEGQAPEPPVEQGDVAPTEPAAPHLEAEFKVSLWPQSMIEFLERKMGTMFEVRGFILDPTQLQAPVEGNATPQALPPESEPLDGDPLAGLITIDEISAQRGFGHSGKSRRVRDDGSASSSEPREARRLSSQLQSYYINHLDPYDTPEPKDLDALQALEQAGNAYDARLKACFSSALKELEQLGYPGVTDPKLTISTRLRAVDGLNHSAAVQYEVPTFAGAALKPHLLPEDSNGLGYQNLVSMVFGLMSFRDKWMKVGKAGNTVTAEGAFIPPLHLVLVEEPEAHLHAQVQQVFINHAYAVLRNHDKLKNSPLLTTQLVVSTHSCHVAHACDFACLRYFRRLPAAALAGAVPTASVINLSEVFGAGNATEKFATRYLKASHCDLFFADGVVLVEGPAERILVPHFVLERPEFEYLRRCYVTWLEIGGAHAHRLRPLIEHLGITTLIITDLDAKDGTSGAAQPPKRGTGQKARNETLKTWLPADESLDTILDLPEASKVAIFPTGYGVRVAYQSPVQAAFKAHPAAEALANTFEDALVYQNVPFFTDRDGIGLTAKVRDAITEAADIEALSAKLHVALKSGGKAEFALDLLYSDDIATLQVPSYIKDGLLWLIEQLKKKEKDLVPPDVAA